MRRDALREMLHSPAIFTKKFDCTQGEIEMGNGKVLRYLE